jgi:hypothetical protein
MLLSLTTLLVFDVFLLTVAKLEANRFLMTKKLLKFAFFDRGMIRTWKNGFHVTFTNKAARFRCVSDNISCKVSNDDKKQ